MPLNEYRFTRELLGLPLARRLPLLQTSYSWHSLAPAPAASLAAAAHHGGGVEALDIDRQDGR